MIHRHMNLPEYASRIEKAALTVRNGAFPAMCTGANLFEDHRRRQKHYGRSWWQGVDVGIHERHHRKA